MGLVELGMGLVKLVIGWIGLIELRIGLIELGIGLIELGIGLMELGIGLRNNNARRTVLARVSGLIVTSNTAPTHPHATGVAIYLVFFGLFVLMTIIKENKVGVYKIKSLLIPPFPPSLPNVASRHDTNLQYCAF